MMRTRRLTLASTAICGKSSVPRMDSLTSTVGWCVVLLFVRTLPPSMHSRIQLVAKWKPEFAYTGTTLSMSKKGSGLAKVLDPCIKKCVSSASIALFLLPHKHTQQTHIQDIRCRTSTSFRIIPFAPPPSARPLRRYLKTKSYYTTCVKWGVEDSCFANGHFPTQGSTADAIYNVPTDEQTDGCTDGYCSCVN